MTKQTVAEQMQELIDSTPLLEGRAIGLYPVSAHTLSKWIQQIEEEKEEAEERGRDSEQVSLITAGLKPRNPMSEMASQIAEIKEFIKPLRGLVLEQLSKRVNPVAIATANSAPSIDLASLRERVNMGGEPNPGTPPDKRLKKNKVPAAAK